MKSKFNKKTRNKYIFCYTMLLVAIWCVVTYFIINSQALLMAFRTEEGGVLTLDNWRMIIAELKDQNSNIWMALINTLKYFVLGLIKLPLTFVISYFLYKKIKGYKFFRTIFFLPSMVAPVIFVLLFKDLIKIGGPIDILLNQWFGYQIPNLVSTFENATNTILAYCFWSGFGATLLIFVGAMNRIPTEIIEAAKIDGCGKFKEFIKIIVPLCWDNIYTMTLLSVINIFMSTGPILYFTGGDYGTSTLAYWIFDQVRNGTYHYPSAVGLFFTLMGVPVIILMNWLMKKGGTGVEY